MFIKQIYTKCLAEASYYIESNGVAAVIDPIRDYFAYLELAEKRNAKIMYIFETHFHADFVSGHIDLAKLTGAKIIFGPGAQTEYSIYNAFDGEEFSLGKLTLEVLHTPGHTPESVCYLLCDEAKLPQAIFTGDTLFVGDVGRPDLLGGTMSKEELAGMMFDSLRNKIMKLPDKVVVYPAHGAGSACGKNIGKETQSTIGLQKTSNYALQEMSKETFISKLVTDLPAPPAYFPFNAKLNKIGYKPLVDVFGNSNHALSLSLFEQKMKQGAIVLDVRDAQEALKGFIPLSYHVGLSGDFAPWVGSLVPFDKEILLITEKGKEEEAILRLSRIGYDSVSGYLDGGFATWRTSGKDDFHAKNITAIEFKEKIKNINCCVLDVRSESEQLTGSWPNAEKICLSKLEKSLDKLDKDKHWYVYCAGGYRSAMACVLLKNKGFAQVVNIQGGYQAIESIAVTCSR